MYVPQILDRIEKMVLNDRIAGSLRRGYPSVQIFPQLWQVYLTISDSVRGEWTTVAHDGQLGKR